MSFPCKNCEKSGTIHERCEKYYAKKDEREKIKEAHKLYNGSYVVPNYQKDAEIKRRKTMWSTHKDWR